MKGNMMMGTTPPSSCWRQREVAGDPQTKRTSSYSSSTTTTSKLLVGVAILCHVVFSCYIATTPILWSASPALLVPSSEQNRNEPSSGLCRHERAGFLRYFDNSHCRDQHLVPSARPSMKMDNDDDENDDKQQHPACATAVTSILSFPTHGCHLSDHWPWMSLCQFANLTVDTSKLLSQARGGEPLRDVMGQEEDAEYLHYEPGAFTVVQPPLMNWSTDDHHHDVLPPKHYIDSVLDALLLVQHKDESSVCDEVWPGMTLFLTRYEYVNLFHTVTDWWNAYFTATSLFPVNVIFLDAHPAGNLDPVWSQLFGGRIAFARHLPANSRVCFEVVRLVPAGYNSPLNRRPLSSSQHTVDVAAMRCFVDHVLQSLHLADHQLSTVKRIPGKVVVIDRVPYVAHPRSKTANTPRLVSNLQDLAKSLPRLNVPNRDQLSVQVVTLVADTMAQQIRSIREADVLIANHGAGLTHLVFLDDGATVIELSPKIPLFSILAEWKPTVQFELGPMARNGELSRVQWDQTVVPVVTRALARATSPS